MMEPSGRYNVAAIPQRFLRAMARDAIKVLDRGDAEWVDADAFFLQLASERIAKALDVDVRALL